MEVQVHAQESGEAEGMTEAVNVSEKLKGNLQKVLDNIVQRATVDEDHKAVQLFMSYFPPPGKTTMVSIPGAQEGTLMDRCNAIVTAVFNNQVSIEAARDALSLLADVSNVVKTDELTRRIDELTARTAALSTRVIAKPQVEVLDVESD